MDEFVLYFFDIICSKLFVQDDSNFFQIRLVNILFKYDMALGILIFSFLNNVHKIQFFLFTEK